MMKINLESNFKLLGSGEIDSIEINGSSITVKDFLRIMSDRSTKSPEYLNSEGTDLEGNLWQVHVNGRILNFYEKGINTVLKDGDTVAICANLIDGG